MRKYFILISVAVISLVMNSCLGDFGADSSPGIGFTSFHVNPIFKGDTIVGAQDTIFFKPSELYETYLSDTMYVGDTILFVGTFYCETHHLTAIKITWDSTYVKTWFDFGELGKSLLSDRADVSKGLLYLNPGFGLVQFPIFFTPIKAGNTPFKLQAESDSKFSPYTFPFTFIIQEK